MLLPALEREPVRKLKHALRAIDRYLRSQGAWLVNYAERHRAGLRVGASVSEGTANFLANRPMAKSQQMRWSRRGANLLLQVPCAVYNGALGSGFGQMFKPALGSGLHWAEAAELPNFRTVLANSALVEYISHSNCDFLDFSTNVHRYGRS